MKERNERAGIGVFSVLSRGPENIFQRNRLKISGIIANFAVADRLADHAGRVWLIRPNLRFGG